MQTFEKVVQDSGAILVLMIKYIDQSMIYFGQENINKATFVGIGISFTSYRFFSICIFTNKINLAYFKESFPNI